MSKEFNPFKEMAVASARAAYDKKAENIVLVDARKLSIVADYMLLVSVTSPAHLEAVQQAIEDVMEPSGIELRHRDGSHSALWRVLDYGGVLVHLMHVEARRFYALDKLYHDSPKQRWHPSRRLGEPPVRGMAVHRARR